MKQHFPFIRDDVLPSWFANAIQRFLSVQSANFQVVRASSSSIKVAAGPDVDAAIVAIQGKWRWVEADVVRAVGGGAGTYTVWATAKDNDIVDSPQAGTDLTDYSFDLLLTTGAEPVAVPGSVEIWQSVAQLDWDGRAITSLRMTRGPFSDVLVHAARHAIGGSDPLTPSAIGAAAQVDLVAEAATRLSTVNAEAAARVAAVAAEQAARIAADVNNPSAAEKAALGGTAGTPSGSNKYVTATDPAITAGTIQIGGGYDWYASGDPSANVLACDGRAISRATFATCFARIGTSFGPGDGSTTFNIPDSRGRTSVAPDNMGTAAGAAGRLPNSNRTLGQTGGAELHSHTGNAPSHTHTGTAPDHLHFAGSLATVDHAHSMGTATRGSGNGYSAGTGESVAFTNHVHGINGSGALAVTGATGASDRVLSFTTSGPSATAFTTATTSTMQPYLIASKVIRVA